MESDETAVEGGSERGDRAAAAALEPIGEHDTVLSSREPDTELEDTLEAPPASDETPDTYGKARLDEPVRTERVPGNGTPVSGNHGFNGDLGELPVVPRDFYVIGEEFARGGIGRITRARDKRLNRVVAIKELRRDSHYTRLRFTREVRITAKLQHPNIIPVHEAGRWASGEPFFAMKLVDGGSLEDAIEECHRLTQRLGLLRHVAAVADAMAYAHTRQVVHRDLKPSNVLLGPFGETVVIDWGLAKDLSDPQQADLPAPTSSDTVEAYETSDGVILGTPPFMPPEQARGEPVDERADVYALGAMLYHVLTGRVPYFEYHARDIVKKVVSRPPTPLFQLEPDAPPDLVAIVRKAMARDPDDRYPNASGIAEDLDAFLTGGLVGAYQYSAAELLKRFVARQRTAVMTGILALIALAIGGVWSFANIREQRNRAQDARAKAEKLAELEGQARREALHQLDESILNGARSAVGLDPTYALGLLKRLGEPIPGAATVAADAQERGVARHVLALHSHRIEALSVTADGESLATAGADGTVRTWSADGKPGAVFDQPRSRIAVLAYSPDGKRLAGAGYDDIVWIWDLTGKAPSELTGHAAPIRGLAWTPDGSHLATVGEDGVRVWDAATGASQSKELPADRPLFAAWSPDGTQLLTGSHAGTVRLWTPDLSGEPVVLDHGGEVKAAAYSPDGQHVATACSDGTVRLWTTDGTETDRWKLHDEGAEVVAWTPDGGSVVSGGMDGTVRITGIDGSSHALAHHRERVSALAVSPDGRIVAAGSWDRTIALYDRVTGTRRRLFGHRDVISALAFLPHHHTLASTSWDRALRLWPLGDERRHRLAGHAVGVKTVDYSPDGKRLASGGHDDLVRIWDAASGRLEVTLAGHSDHVYRVLFSPDGRWVASSSDDRTVRLWSPDGKTRVVLEGHQADVEELAFSPDGALLASGGEDSAVGLWRVADRDGELLRGHERPVLDVAFSPDGEILASSSRDDTVRLWTRRGKEMAVLRGHTDDVTSVVFSPKGDTLASAAEDGVRLWPLPTGEARAIAGTKGAELVRFAPGGDRIAISKNDNTIQICALAGGPCRELRGHAAKINALAYTPDGGSLVSAGSDSTLRIWDVDSGESRPLRGHEAPVFDVAVAPDGQRIASASGDTTIRIWPVDKPPEPTALASWLDEVTSYTTRGLSAGPAAQ